jgi:hypothetical protein
MLQPDIILLYIFKALILFIAAARTSLKSVQLPQFLFKGMLW